MKFHKKMNKYNNKHLKDYNKLPEIPYDTVINLKSITVMYLQNVTPVKICTKNNNQYRTKPELWDILIFLNEWMDYINYNIRLSPINLLIYIDEKDDKWINDIISIIRSKHLILLKN
jgi:hypothetical protein